MHHILVFAIALFAFAWPSYAQEKATEDAEAPADAEATGNVVATADAEAPAAEEDTRMFYPRSGGDAETEDTQSPAAEGIFESSSASSVILSMLGFVLLFGACVVGGWFLFKRGFLKKPFSKDGGKLKVAESRMLGNRQFLMVVEYEDNKILLGVGPGKIDYLTSLNTYRNEFPPLESKTAQNLSEMR